MMCSRCGSNQLSYTRYETPSGELARELGLKPITIWRWENGINKPSLAYSPAARRWLIWYAARLRTRAREGDFWVDAPPYEKDRKGSVTPPSSKTEAVKRRPRISAR